uniref:GRF-type domain-containing protein n=1 Tax=Setaria italica TaxID=4555 RepID=K3XXZ8_SETIT
MALFGCEYKRRRWYVRYVGESNVAGPVPPALPVPLCRCGAQAEVKQSRHPKTAGRAFYVCKWTFDPLPAAPCDFFQWIDGPDKYDPRFRLFPYHSTELKPYHQFRRWVPPPPNPPRMTDEEKQEAACRHVRDPPMCKCGVPAKLMCPNLGDPPKFTPFFRCSLKTHDGWPLCDFNEYIYGPMVMWPTEEEVREFESENAPWPCVSSPSDRCKCGILATEGVVPSELGYGSFYGNAHGDYWEGRTCDWEDFCGRYDLLLKLGNTSEPWKSRKQQEIKEKIRKKYDVPIPDDDLLWGKIYQDMVHETGVEPKGLYARETIIKYWRQNRSKEKIGGSCRRRGSWRNKG